MKPPTSINSPGFLLRGATDFQFSWEVLAFFLSQVTELEGMRERAAQAEKMSPTWAGFESIQGANRYKWSYVISLIKNHWTLLWRGLDVYSRGLGSPKRPVLRSHDSEGSINGRKYMGNWGYNSIYN